MAESIEKEKLALIAAACRLGRRELCEAILTLKTHEVHLMDNTQLYSQRLERVNAAVACTHADRIPFMPSVRSYPYVRNGHSMGEAMNDLSLAQQDLKDFVLALEPDMAVSYTASLAGAGDAMTEMGVSLLEWPGRVGGTLDNNGVTQIIEDPPMEEDDYEDLSSLLSLLPHYDFTLPKATAYRAAARQFEQELAAMGFPTAYNAIAAAPFDVLGLCLRGTLGLMTDIYMYEDEVCEALELLLPHILDHAVAQAAQSAGRFVYVPLKNGMEGYLSLEQYEDFYFPTVKKLCEGLIAKGLTPLLYCEGPYSSRLEILNELPEKQCVIRLDSADMPKAKAVLGKTHCLSGGFYAYDLVHSTPEAIREYLKFLLDTMGDGGGYIFDFGDRLDSAKSENLEAMMETFRDCAIY